MAMKVSASVFILLLSIILSVGTFRVVNAQKTWCVAKPSASQATLLENINFACSKVDCSCLQKGGACYTPDNLINHASIAMNSYYQSQGRNVWNCNFKNSGLLTISDPSYGSCSYM
ncbi:carbohydrate-binding X8 domain superfamily protein [Artemisia annua]|uniref:Carbohydrate-binding X8 domain superfamily protein n=1 Tax=Artemisia annua TaxID=35608 RepID=A0A2U1KBZ5_ARTAN|nr:carbohydrate-binding X8 domain superfamily protein [Artemisia annua]